MNIAWLAGFFDGEGCLTILRSRGSHYTPVVSITNTNLEVLKKIQVEFGGTIQARNTSSKWNAAYSLVFSGTPETRRILQVMLPYLILKKNEVEFFLTNWTDTVNGKQGKPVTEEVLQIREALKQQLSAMKSRNNIPQLKN